MRKEKINLKLISLNMDEVKSEQDAVSAISLLSDLQALDTSNEASITSFIQKTRLAGLPLTKLALKRALTDGRLLELLREAGKEEILNCKNKEKATKAARIRTEEVMIDGISITMIDDPLLTYRIMKDEVTIELYKLAMRGYKYKGLRVDELLAVLNSPSQKDSMTYVNLIDAREFAIRLSNLTGRKFRVQTAEEWDESKYHLTGKYATWTETLQQEQNDHKSFYIVLSLPNYKSYGGYLGRWQHYAIRLVEDK